jgi:hypothetical protein
MFTAGEGCFYLGDPPLSSPCALVTSSLLFITPPGPVSESDFFTWEALICGPKDTPFVIYIPILPLFPSFY